MSIVNKQYGFWTWNDQAMKKKREAKTDHGIIRGLIEFFANEPKNITIYDLGCGAGQYTAALVGAGFTCRGFDGNPHTEQITNGLCHVMNLAEPQSITDADWIVCLEVAEHIPAEFEAMFLRNITLCRKGLILSWAPIGQPGRGHVNCKNSEDVIQELQKQGFTFCEDASVRLRNTANSGCFSKNTMVFVRD